jgi:hypothetical protein
MGVLIRLIAPRGCDECNHGGVRYPVHPDGCVYVDAEAVEPLLQRGGFVRHAIQCAAPVVSREIAWQPGSVEFAKS